METLRRKLARLFMPKFDRYLMDEALQIHFNLCRWFGSRAVREFLNPQNIAEIQIIRVNQVEETMH